MVRYWPDAAGPVAGCRLPPEARSDPSRPAARSCGLPGLPPLAASAAAPCPGIVLVHSMPPPHASGFMLATGNQHHVVRAVFLMALGPELLVHGLGLAGD